LNYYNYYFD